MAMIHLDSLRLAAPMVAAIEHAPIATTPRLFCAGNSARTAEIAANFPLDEVVDYAADTHDCNPAALSSMAIRLTESGPETAMSTGPKLHEDAIYYPFINLRIGAKTPTWYLNTNLRHELHHPFDPARQPFYTQKYAGAIIRIGGVMALAGYIENCITNHGTIVPGVNDWDEIINLATNASLASFVGTATVFGRWAAYLFSKDEYAASVCAYKNRNFKPIK